MLRNNNNDMLDYDCHRDNMKRNINLLKHGFDYDDLKGFNEVVDIETIHHNNVKWEHSFNRLNRPYQSEHGKTFSSGWHSSGYVPSLYLDYFVELNSYLLGFGIKHDHPEKILPLFESNGLSEANGNLKVTDKFPGYYVFRFTFTPAEKYNTFSSIMTTLNEFESMNHTLQGKGIPLSLDICKYLLRNNNSISIKNTVSNGGLFAVGSSAEITNCVVNGDITAIAVNPEDPHGIEKLNILLNAFRK